MPIHCDRPFYLHSEQAFALPSEDRVKLVATKLCQHLVRGPRGDAAIYLPEGEHITDAQLRAIDGYMAMLKQQAAMKGPPLPLP